MKTPFPQRIRLMSLNPTAVRSTFVLKGLSGASSAVFHEDTGLLEVQTVKGSVILFR